MKCCPLILFLFLGFFANAQSTGNGGLLIPYKNQDKWGLCYRDKSIVVAPRYDHIYSINPYFLAVKGDSTEVLDSSGKLINDSACYYIGTIKSDKSYLFVKPVRGNTSLNITGKFQKFDSAIYLYRLQDNHLIQLSKAACVGIISPTSAVNNKIPTLFIITQNGRYGVYDVIKERILIAPKYTHLHIPNGKFIVAWNDSGDLEVRGINGNILSKNKVYLNPNISEILDNGYCIVIPDGWNPDNDMNVISDLQNQKGVDVLKNRKGLRILNDMQLLQCQAEDNVSHNQLYNWYDLEGKLLVSHIKDYKPVAPELVAIYDTGYEKLTGLFNYKTRRMIWKNNFSETTKVKLVFNYNFGIPQIEVDSMTYFFGANGDTLMQIGYYNHYYKSQFRLMKGLEIEAPFDSETPQTNKYFTALRNSEEKPFSIYDENYHKVKRMQDFLGNDNQVIYAFEENNKWKLADYNGLVLPDAYDSIVYTKIDHNFRLYKNGKSQIYLRTARKVIPAFDYDEAIGYRNHNCYLGIKYLEGLKHGQDNRFYDQVKCRVDLINEKGQVIYSFVNEPKIGIKYALTKSNQIIEYPEDNKYFYFRIHNTKTKAIKEINERYLRFESYQGMPVVAVFSNNGDTDNSMIDLWNINKWEQIATSNTENGSFQSNEMEFFNQKDTLEALALIKVQDNPEFNQMDFTSNKPRRINTIIGFIGIDGTFYKD